jgi:hypothetical protein
MWLTCAPKHPSAADAEATVTAAPDLIRLETADPASSPPALRRAQVDRVTSKSQDVVRIAELPDTVENQIREIEAAGFHVEKRRLVTETVGLAEGRRGPSSPPAYWHLQQLFRQSHSRR